MHKIYPFQIIFFRFLFIIIKTASWALDSKPQRTVQISTLFSAIQEPFLHLQISFISDKLFNAKMDDQQQFCLRWNDFQTNMVASFKHLRDEKSFTDVTIACDGQSTKAHKMILSACSPYFKVGDRSVNLFCR